MDHMSMGGSGSGPACITSMLWNWHTIDACFISTSWQIKSASMFAGSCIGVILLVMSLELLRRLGKEYDKHILAQYQRHISASNITILNKGAEEDCCAPPAVQESRAATAFRPNISQQMVRATLHLLQFAVAYFVMLLAMYYNGYIIISILIGAWLGSFVFNWETVNIGGPQQDATVCCG